MLHYSKLCSRQPGSSLSLPTQAHNGRWPRDGHTCLPCRDGDVGTCPRLMACGLGGKVNQVSLTAPIGCPVQDWGGCHCAGDHPDRLARGPRGESRQRVCPADIPHIFPGAARVWIYPTGILTISAAHTHLPFIRANNWILSLSLQSQMTITLPLQTKYRQDGLPLVMALKTLYYTFYIFSSQFKGLLGLL